MRALLATAGVALAVAFVYGVMRQRPTSPTPGPGPSPPEPHPSAACPPDGTRVLLIGDSFAEGLGPQLKAIAATCGTPIHVVDKRGSHVTQWQRESLIRPAINAAAANVALVSLGGNDFQDDPEALQDATVQVVTKLVGAGMRVMWIAPLTLPYEDTAGVREMWKRAVGDDWFPSETINIPRAPDNIHAYPSGYKLWAEQIWPWMSGRLSWRTAVK